MSTLNNTQLKEGIESEPESLTPLQVSIKLGMSLKWVEKYTQAGRIPGQVKAGGRWRYRRKDVEEAYQSGNFLLDPRPIKAKPKKAPPSYFLTRAGRPLWRHNGI